MGRKFQTVYDRPYTGAVTENNFSERDPYWQLGYLLAQNYNTNYNKRGIDKATAVAEEQLARSRAAMNGNEYTGANKSLDNIESNYLNNNNAPAYEPMQGMPKGAGERIDNFAGNFPDYKSEYAMPYNTGANIANIAQNATQGYENAKYLPTNAGDKINAIRGGYGAYEPVQRTAADTAMQNYAKAQGITPEPKAVPQDFDAEQFKMDFYKQQRALGRPDYQIEAALETLAPQINQMTVDNNLKKSSNIIEQLAALAPTSDDLNPTVNNAERMKLISALRKYDPDMANIYAKDLISNRDTWANKSAAQRAYVESNAKAQARMNQLEVLGRQAGLQGDELKNFIMHGTLKGNSANNTTVRNNRSYTNANNGGKGRSLIGSKEFEFAKSRVDEISEKMRNHEQLTPQEQADFNRYGPYVDKILADVYGTGNPSESAPKNNYLSNWNNVVEIVQQQLHKGTSKKEILKFADSAVKDGYMPSEFYTAIQNSFKPIAKKDEQKSEPLFKDWGNNGQRSGAAAMSASEALGNLGDILTGKKPLIDLAHR